MKIQIKPLLFSILIPLFLGSFVGFLTAPFNNYYEISLPSFAPPGILFPIVWTILYILMGISSYLIIISCANDKNDALFIYGTQLLINLLWSFIFFVFRFYLLSFIWILLLIWFVVIMIKSFYNISKISAYLQILYLLWLIFAAFLNLAVYLINLF